MDQPAAADFASSLQWDASGRMISEFSITHLLREYLRLVLHLEQGQASVDIISVYKAPLVMLLSNTYKYITAVPNLGHITENQQFHFF